MEKSFGSSVAPAQASEPRADLNGSERFTPGPWRIFWAKDALGIENSHQIIGIGELNGAGITDCGFGVWRGGDGEAIANAHLIAAAPEMYRYLEIINKIASPNPERTFDGVIRDLDAITDFARAALKKARGES